MSEDFDEVRTNDMALVAFLKMLGFKHKSVTWEPSDIRSRGTAYWVFWSDAVDESEVFLEGSALVEPRQFSQSYGRVRDEMFRVRRKYEDEQNANAGQAID